MDTLHDYIVIVKEKIEKGIYKFPKTSPYSIDKKMGITKRRGCGIRGPKPR